MRWIDGAPKGAVSYQPAKWSTGYRPKNAFVESAASASSAVLAMCGFIVLFQVINAMPVVSVCNAFMARLLASRGWSALGESLVPCLLEVTRGCMLSVTVGLPFTAFVAGFGGLSVHFQNFAICREIQPDKPRYLLLRLTQGCLCSVLVSVGLRLPFFADQLAVTSAAVSTEGMTMRFSGISDSFGAVMLIMCLMSVICLPRVTTRSDV